MSRKKAFVPVIVLIIALFGSCSSQQSHNDENDPIIAVHYNDESDFAFMVWHDQNAVEIFHYIGSSKDVSIPPQIRGLPVTTIRENAFKEMGLTSIIIPNSVTHIGKASFAGNQLTRVTISESITTIGEDVFRDNKLTSVTIPNSVTHIGKSSFAGNELIHVTIPESVTDIGENAFGNNKLTSIIISESVTNIGVSAFSNNYLTEIIIPKNITSINNDVFFNNRLTSITIPENIVSIGAGAFARNNLTEIIIPKNVTSIGNVAFGINPSLRKITIGENVILGLDDFPLEFSSFYIFGVTKKGGTYIYSGYHWSPEDKTIPVRRFDSFMAGRFSDIAFLADMPDLEEVKLYHNYSLTDITPLSGLTKLSELFIENCPNIESIEPLSSVTSLKYLYFGHNINYDYKALVPLWQLEWLHIYNSKDEKEEINVSHIGQLHSLKSLSLEQMLEIINIEALQDLVNLERLEISGVDNLDIYWMSGLRNLTEVELESCTINNISPLANLPNLANVNLQYTKIRDIAPLLNSNSIKYIYVFASDVEAGISDDLRSLFEQRNISLDAR